MVAFFVGYQYQQSKVMFGGFDPFYVKQGDISKGYGVNWYPIEKS